MKAVRIVFSVFIALGIALFAIGYIGSEQNAAYFQRSPSVEGYLPDVDDRGESCELTYAVDGETYVFHMDVYDSGMYIGLPVTVYYDADNPGSYRTTYNDLVFFVLRILGLTFAVMGLVGVLIPGFVASNREKVLRDGTRISAHIEEIHPNLSVTLHGRHPWRLVCRGVDPTTRQERIYYSPNIYHDPTGRLLDDQVEVAVLGSRYVVDLSKVLPSATDRD